jgi:glycosyltransferase involved in cell wall biosynthesis
VGREQVRDTMARSCAGLVTLLPMPSYIDALPIKMFEYMSAELPVIASNFSLWRGIVEQARCGVCVDPSDPADIAAAIRRYVDDAVLVEAHGRAGGALRCFRPSTGRSPNASCWRFTASCWRPTAPAAVPA